MKKYHTMYKIITAGLLSILFTGLSLHPAVSVSFSRNASIDEFVDLIINDDGSGDPTDKKVDIPPYIPDSGITPTLTINFTILGVNDSETTRYFGDDPGEDWEYISINGDILFPVNETTLYHVGSQGDWICLVTPTKPGGVIIPNIEWIYYGSDWETIDIINGSFVDPAPDIFPWSLDCNITVTVRDMDQEALKYACVYLLWEENNIQFNKTEGDNTAGNGRNGEYTFWIHKTDQRGDQRRNITIAVQDQPGSIICGYEKILSYRLREDICFDVAYISEIYAELPANHGGSISGASFGLIINTGPETILYEDMEKAKISVTSDVEGASLYIGVNAPEHWFPTIRTNQAWGSITEQNLFLIDLLQDNEELLNMTPDQTFYYEVFRQNYTGTAHFSITIEIGNRITFLETTVTFVNGPEQHIELLRGERAHGYLHYKNTAVGTFGPITPLMNFSSIQLIDGDPLQIQQLQHLLRSRILQYIIPITSINFTQLSFMVTFPREIPPQPFYQRFQYMTGLQKDNISLINEPHQLKITGMNGIFLLSKGVFFQMIPPRFAFAGVCDEVTIIQ